MILTQQLWNCENGQPHNLVKVVFDTTDIQKAAWIADQKIQFVNVHSPGGVTRSQAIIRNRIIAGKLADHAVEKYINQNIAVQRLSLAIQEYDAVRTDNWRNHDLYDLQISNNSLRKDIEVRSSFCYMLRRAERIIQMLSIYGWYTSGNKSTEPHRDFYWQVIYYLRPQDIPKDPRWPELPTFEEQLNKGLVQGYIVGGATKTMLETQGRIRRDQDNAYYQSITPICASMDVSGILTATLAL